MAEAEIRKINENPQVADGATCFVTSANLTGRAMDKKIEAGLLVLGGDTPRQLEDHLRSLTDTKVVSRV